MRQRLIRSIAAAATAAAVVPAAAQAATVNSQPGQPVRYAAGTGEQNRLAVAYESNRIVLRDPGATIVATGDGRCTVGPGPHRATCPYGRFVGALGDQDDRATVEGFVRRFVSLDGGTGDDDLTLRASAPGARSAQLFGGPDDDRLTGAGGGESLFGGGGVDALSGGDGADFLSDGDGTLTGVSADTLDGGGGRDQVSYNRTGRPGVLVDLSRAGGGNGEPGEIDTLRNLEDAVGGSGNDRLIAAASGSRLLGNGGDDRLTGGAGNDSLHGNAGDDDFSGNGGNDNVHIDDFTARRGETASCGAGFDRVLGSFPGDLLGRTCDRVRPRGRGVDMGFGIEMRTVPVSVDTTRGAVAFRVLCRARSRYSACRGRLAVAPANAGRPNADRANPTNYGTRSFALRRDRWSTVRVPLTDGGLAALRVPGVTPFEVQILRRKAGGGNSRSTGYTTRF